MKILAIIPAYNEELNILGTVTEIREVRSDIDILVVNDASTDSTREILEKNDIPHINLSVNLGIGGGVQAGYIYARDNGYDIAVQIDGDGQHVPAEIEKIVKPLCDGSADMTVESRFVTREGFQSSKARRIGIYFLSALINLFAGIKVNDVTSGFRGVNKKYIEIFAEDYAQDYPEPEAIVTVGKKKGKVVEVPVIMRERTEGISSITSFKSVYYMIKVSLAIIIRSIGK